MPGTTQANDNKKETGANSYNAIMIGSGISGGWAAKELCEKRLKILSPESEENIEHVKDYPAFTVRAVNRAATK